MGTAPQAGQEKRHSGYRPRGRAGFLQNHQEPGVAGTGVRRDCLELSINVPRPLANQMPPFLEFASRVENSREERAGEVGGVGSFLT